MIPPDETPRETRLVRAGALGLLALFVLPLVWLAVLDILRGHEDLTLEWSVLGGGLAVGVVALAQAIRLLRSARGHGR